jgi:hypothetical protein
MKEIPLNKGMVALVDDCDYELVANIPHKWYVRQRKYTNYAVARYKKDGRAYCIKMHRLILGVEDNRILVDHIDGNGLNNTRNNIRQATVGQNNANRHKRKAGGLSKYKGVTPRYHKWAAFISHNNKTLYIGIYDTEIDAARAYNEKARELFGEFARPNLLEV